MHIMSNTRTPPAPPALLPRPFRVGPVSWVRGVADARPATRDPGRNQRLATPDPERFGPPGPARTYPVRPGHTRPGPDICQDWDFKIIFDCNISDSLQ